MKKTKKILITEDHSVVSRGLNYLISHNFQDCFVNRASSLHEMQTSLAIDNFTHLILDLNQGNGYSIDIIPELIRRYPQLMILIYTVSAQDVYARKLCQLGVSGFLSNKADEKVKLRTLDIFFQLQK